MRWRVNNIPADVRTAARDAAKAVELPLGPWLSRAILQSQSEPPAVPPADDPTHAASSTLDDASAETPQLPPVDRHPRELANEDAPARGAAGQGVSSLATVRQTPAKFHHLSSLLSSRRAKVLLAAAASVAMVAGAIALWHFSSTPGDPRQAAGPGQPPRSSQPPSELVQPPAPPQSLAEIVEDLRRDAENGDAMAQHDLALAYLNGRGVPQNYQIAAEWFEKAAEAGLERAQFNLAVLHENALGVPEDIERAFKLYGAAAEQGFGPAQHNLAVAYAQGRGTSRDYRAAALWFRRAADQGIASAQFNLGMIYEKGLAGPPDEQTAYGWYRLAASAGSEAAVARLAAIEGRIARAPAEATPGPRATKPTVAEVAEIQRLLSLLSFHPGAADGKPGKATREAIRQYQQVAGLPVNGEPSQALLTHLRQVTNMMRGGGR